MNSQNLQQGMAPYLEAIRKIKRLTPEQELAMTTEFAQARDPKLAHKIVEANLRLVLKVVFELGARNGELTLDLVQEGNLGLMHAVQKFDPRKGVKLSTYSMYWIRAFVFKHMLKHQRLFSLNKTAAQRKIYYNLGKEMAMLGLDVLDDAAVTKVAKNLGVREKDVRSTTSLMAPLVELDDAVQVCPNKRPDAAAEDADMRRVMEASVATASKKLSEREWHVIKKRVFEDEKHTLQDLADEFGLSRERVRQIEVRAMVKMRAGLVAQHPDLFGERAA